METHEYLAYIAYFIKANSFTTNVEVKEYLEAKLGGSLTEPDEAKAKNLARHLYKSYVVHLYTRYDAFHLAKNLKDSQLEELLAKQIALDKSVGTFYDTVDAEISKSKTVDNKIREYGDAKYKAVLSALSKVRGAAKKDAVKKSVAPVAPKKALASQDYLGFMATFVKFEPQTSKKEFRDYFEMALGGPPLLADDSSIKKEARDMYKAHVLSRYTRYGAFRILDRAGGKLEKYLDDQIALDKSFKIFIDPGTSAAIKTNEQVDGGIKALALDDYLSILEGMDVSKSPTKIKADAAKVKAAAKSKREASKPVVKKVVKKPVAKKSSSPLVKKVVKKPVKAGKKVVAKKSSSPVAVKKVVKKPVKKISKSPSPVKKVKKVVKKSSSPLVVKKVAKKVKAQSSSPPVVKKVVKKTTKVAKVIKKKPLTQTEKLMAMKSGKEFSAHLAGKAKPKPAVVVQTVKKPKTTEMTLGELKNVARTMKIKGFSTMKKEELKAALGLK